MRGPVFLRLSCAILIFTSAAHGAVDGFADFWPRFRGAVARNDEAAVRAMTRLPFLFEGEPHDADRFGRVYAALFDEAARACLAKSTPAPDQDRYSAACGQTIFVFGREESGWRFVEFAADPEAEH